MNLRQYLITMAIATALCWVALGFVLVNVDPFQSGNIGFIFFYISVFLGLLGLFSLLFFAWHRFFSRTPQPLFKYVQRSYEQAAILSGAVTALLYLQAHQWLRMWNAVIFLVMIILLFSFRSGRQSLRAEHV